MLDTFFVRKANVLKTRSDVYRWLKFDIWAEVYFWIKCITMFSLSNWLFSIELRLKMLVIFHVDLDGSNCFIL